MAGTSMCPAMMFHPVDRVAFNGPERPRDRADSRGRQRAIERAAAQLLGPGQLLAYPRAWTSPAPCRMPRCGTVVDESQRLVHVSRHGDDPGPLPPAVPDAEGVTQGGGGMAARRCGTRTTHLRRGLRSVTSRHDRPPNVLPLDRTASDRAQPHRAWGATPVARGLCN
jgi:hypothetical protein